MTNDIMLTLAGLVPVLALHTTLLWNVHKAIGEISETLKLMAYILEKHDRDFDAYHRTYSEFSDRMN